MKSIFKRAFAAVTSSALVFSQIAATAVNINAADEPLTVNKAWVLSVPFDQKASGSTEKGSALKGYLDLAQMEVKTEDNVEALVFKNDEAKLSNLLSSRWNDELESIMTARLGSKDSITQVTDATKLKQLIKETLIKNIERITTLLKAKVPDDIGPFRKTDKAIDQLKLIDDTTAAKIEAAIHEQGVLTLTADGTATEVVQIDEIGPIIGQAFVKYFEKSYGQEFVNDDGTPIVFDWSNYHISGSVAVKAEYGNYDKTAKYSAVFTDEKGNKISTFAAMSKYMLDKGYNESGEGEQGGLNIMLEGIKNGKQDIKDLGVSATKYVKKAYENKELIGQAAEMIQGISFNEDDPNDAYSEYIKEAEAGLEALGLPAKYVKKLIDTFNAKRPTNLYDAAEKAEKNPKVTKGIDQGLVFLHKIVGDKAKVELSATDITDIMKKGTNWQTKFPNGYSTDNVFDYMLKDADENDAKELAALKDAIIKYKEDDIKAEFKKAVAGVEAHKKITLNSENNYTEFNGNMKYDVELVIDKIILKDIVETTEVTTSTTPASTASETTGSSDSTPSTETTAVSGSSETPSTDTTAAGGSSETPSTETTAAGGSSETPSTETTAASGSSETPSTETTAASGSSETPSTETTAASGSSDTPSTDTTAASGSSETPSTETTAASDSSTPSSDTTVSGTETTPIESTGAETTSTTPASSLEFIQSGMAPELIYWSEEESDFTFTNMKVTMNIYKVNADKSGYELAKSVDVTNAFEPSAKSPKDFDFKGFDQYTIDYNLKDADSISKQISLAGFDAEALMKQDGIVNGFKAKGSTALYLVLRGDSNLNNEIDIQDAKWALDYQVATGQAGYTMSTGFNTEKIEERVIQAKDNEYNNFKFQHYAEDVFNGDGLIEIRDAKAILDYFVAVKQAMLPGAEDWAYDQYLMEGKKVVPNDQLHADPYRFDSAASYGADDKAHTTAQ